MNSPGSRSSWLMTVLTDTETPGTTAWTWALTRAVSCSRSARRNGRTSTSDMANLQNDSAVGARGRRPLPVRYALDSIRPGVGPGVEQAQVGPAGGQDGVDLVGGGQAAADHGRDAGLVADQVAPADQVEAAVVGAGDGGGLAGGHLDEVAAVGGQGPGGGHRLLGLKAARCPVGDGQGRPQRPVVRPGGPDGV